MTSPSRAVFLEELSVAQEKMQDRMDKYVAAWNSGDMATILSYFADEGLDYSDYGLMALHMDKKALVEYFKLMGAFFDDMDINTTAVHGAVDFCVWECIFEFTVMEERAGVPYKKGERGKLFSARMIEWNKEGKIISENDYAVWGNQKGH